MFLKLALLLLCLSAHAEAITWAVKGHVPKCLVAEINRAMGEWELASGGAVEFYEVNGSTPQIYFIWDKRNRYVWYSELSLTLPPVEGIQGFVALNADRIGATDRRLMRTVLLHEIGHVLGLGHSIDEASVMFPIISAPKVVLTAADVEALRSVQNE